MTIVATAQLRYHFLSAGITCHGAWAVAGLLDGVREGRLVVVPLLPRVEVAEAELPVLVRFGEPGLEPALLLVLGDVQQDLDDRGALVGEHLLERADVVEALPPPLLGDETVHAHHDDVLVVAPVEHADLAALRDVGVDAPEVVAGQLALGGRLERRHPQARGVHAAEDVPHGAALAGGVDALQHDEQSLALARPEDVLQPGQADGELLAGRDGGLLVAGRRGDVAGVDGAEIEAATGLDPMEAGGVGPQLIGTARPGAKRPATAPSSPVGPDCTAMCDLLCAPAIVASGGAPTPSRRRTATGRRPSGRCLEEWLPPRNWTPVPCAPRTSPSTRIPRCDPRRARVSRPAWGWGLEHGVNTAGRGRRHRHDLHDPRPARRPGSPSPAWTSCASPSKRAATRRPPPSQVIEQLAARRRSARAAPGHEGTCDRPYWSSFLVADPTSGFVVETSGDQIAVEPVDSVRAILEPHDDPGLRRRPPPPGPTGGPPGRPEVAGVSQRVLADEPVTVDALRTHLASHEGGDDGWTVCMHVESAEHEEATAAALVAELPTSGPPTAFVTTGSPCTSRWLRIPVDGTYR